MENDIYRRVIHELSNKSEKDFGLKRVDDEKTKITQRITKGIYLLLQLIFIIVTSSLFAINYDDASNLRINLHVVIIVTSILGVLNYPSLWKKFTRKYIVVVIMLVSVLIALSFFTPEKVIPQINNNKLSPFISWGVTITIISFVIYQMCYTATSLVELLLDLASVFLPVLPTTFGKSLPDLASETYKILYREIAEEEADENELKYLISAAQADIDSAGIRSLPWVVLLGFGATSFSEIFKGSYFSFLSPSSWLGFLLVIIGLIAIFSIARITYFQSLIIQVANRLLVDISKREEHDRQEKPNSLLILTETHRPGCLLRILFPWKK